MKKIESTEVYKWKHRTILVTCINNETFQMEVNDELYFRPDGRPHVYNKLMEVLHGNREYLVKEEDKEYIPRSAILNIKIIKEETFEKTYKVIKTEYFVRDSTYEFEEIK